MKQSTLDRFAEICDGETAHTVKRIVIETDIGTYTVREYSRPFVYGSPLYVSCYGIGEGFCSGAYLSVESALQNLLTDMELEV